MTNDAADEDYTRFGTLKVAEPTTPPEILDVLVAGGGPGGTAAAVRAKELGLSCLVVDYDDLMKRIRDYPKEKMIKPNYGGGDKLQFPTGGPLLAGLCFDDIDKDEMVVKWKGEYKQHNIFARVGLEFTGLIRGDDGVWTVKTWSHRAGEEIQYRARNVVLAIGAGVPRRFDIPGNTEGLAFRLDDAKEYVGQPALIIGGGTSAAEAVIAISDAKIAAEDESRVYWSYRGGSMPKVSKALSETFFNAYVGNGNITYLSYSEPVMVITAPDKNEYLSVRIDRKVAEGRPPETVHLEFAKSQVVACIGEDLPVKLLQSVGIKVPQVNNRPLILVNRDGETSLPGIFLAGDARGPKYLRCTDYEDSSTFEQVSLKRNIKAAMVEAVQAVEVIAARAGLVVAKAAAAPAVQPADPSVVAAAAAAVVPPAPSEPVAARDAESEVHLVLLHADGTPEEQFPFVKEAMSIGKSNADIRCSDDVYMADQHAVIAKRGTDFVLEDNSGGSGVWLRAQGVEGRPVGEGDLIWLGSQILMGTKAEGRWALAHYNADGVFQSVHPLGPKGLFVGRASEVKLDGGDLSLSRRHAQFRMDGETLKVFDLGSKNGTYVKIAARHTLANGDEFRVGSKRFRFESFAAIAKLAATDVVVETPIEESPAPRPAAAAAAPAPAPAPAPAAAKPAAAAARAPAAPAAKPAAAAPAAAPPSAAAPAAAQPAPAAAAGEAAVAINHAEFPVSFNVPQGQDLLHAYFGNIKARFPGCKVSSRGEPTEHMDEPLGWECKVGLCGLCAVEIVEGADNFLPVDPGSPEMNTVANKAFLDADPKKYRLACVAKVKGPVKLAIPS